MRAGTMTILGECLLIVSLLFSTGGSIAQEETKPDVSEARPEITQKLREDNEALRREVEALKEMIQRLVEEKQRVEEPEESVAEEPMQEEVGAEEPVEELPVSEAEGEESWKKAAEDEALLKVVEQLQRQMDDLRSQKEKVMEDLEAAIRQREDSLEQLSQRLNEMQDEALQRQEFMAGVYENLSQEMVAKKAQDAYGAAGGAKRPPYDIGKMYSLSVKGRELEDAMLSQGDAGLAVMLRFEKVKLYRKLNMYDRASQELTEIINRNLSETVTNAARWTLVEVLQEQEKHQAAIGELEKILTSARDARKKRDAIYGIINLLGDDPQSKIRTIDGLIGRLEGTEPARPFMRLPDMPLRPVEPPGEKAPGAVSESAPSTAVPASPFMGPSSMPGRVIIMPAPEIGTLPAPRGEMVLPVVPGVSAPVPSQPATLPVPAPEAPSGLRPTVPPGATPPPVVK